MTRRDQILSEYYVNANRLLADLFLTPQTIDLITTFNHVTLVNLIFLEDQKPNKVHHQSVQRDVVNN